MKWPWKRPTPAAVVHLEERAAAAEKFVDQAQATVESRADEVFDTAEYFRRRIPRNHLTQLFEDLYGGRA